jgi:hypothetical protein
LFAIEVFGNNHLCRQQRPEFGGFDVFLLEDDLAGIVGNFSGAPVPFDLVERLDLRVTENALDVR